jgi:hypothetical protein
VSAFAHAVVVVLPYEFLASHMNHYVPNGKTAADADKKTKHIAPHDLPAEG